MSGRRHIVSSSGFLVTLAVLLSLASVALCQARRAARIQAPHSPGDDTHGAYLRSTGASVPSVQYQGDAGPLRYDSPPHALQRTFVLPARPEASLPPPQDSSRLLYRPAQPGLARPPIAAGLARGPLGQVDLSLPMLAPYLQAVQSPMASWLSVGPEIRTLVPPEAGLVHDHMLKAQTALHQGLLLAAAGEYRLANILQPGLSEPLLGLALTSFASAQYSYAAAAVHLQSALRSMPALPRLKLRPAELLGQTDSAQSDFYRRSLAKLEGHLRAAPEDVEALLVLGSLRWYEGQATGAQDALARAESARQAQRGSADVPDDPLLDAIRAFRAAADGEKKP